MFPVYKAVYLLKRWSTDDVIVLILKKYAENKKSEN